MEHQGNDRMPFWTDGARGFHEAPDAWWESALQAVLVLALVALVVIGILWLVRRLSAPGGPLAAAPAAAVPALATGGQAAPAPVAAARSAAEDGAIAALRLRYARGEVDRDTYLTTFADLTGRSVAWPGTAPSSEAPTAVDVALADDPARSAEASAPEAPADAAVEREAERPSDSP